MVIAIDGPAGAGKSTVACAVAAALGFTYLDSGAMYRCVALAGIEHGADLDDAEVMGAHARSRMIEIDGDRIELDGRDVSAAIREPRVTEASSRVSVHPPVREAMVKRQRQLIAGERDERDESREHSALRAADDAVEIDTTGLGLDEVVRRIVELAREQGIT
jgi:cytidylate kinase